MDIKLRVGIIATGDDSLNKETPRNTLKLVLEKIESFNIDKIIFNELISNSTIAKNAGIFFSERNVDLFLVITAVWTQDNFLIETLKFTNCPIIFWSPPDLNDNGVLPMGSLVGALQNGGVLTKIGKKVRIIIDDIDSEGSRYKLAKILKILEIVKKLRLMKVGIIGSRCPGMLDTSFHELELTRQIGPEVEHIGIVEVLNELKNLDEKKDKKYLSNLIDLNKVKSVPDKILNESLSIYIAIKQLVKKYDLNALAIRCWPDFKNCDLCAPCFSLSRLSDENIVSACEADVLGAVSMYILNQLTGNNVYLGDLLKVNNNTRETQYYHCGAAATGLSETKEEIIYKLHGDSGPGRVWKSGMVVEFPLKPGRVTIARIGEIKGKYRMIAYSGKAVETGMFTIGNPARIILDKEPENVINKLIESGAEHHQIVVHGDIIKDLEILCDMLNIELILI